jgi:hypothetical protein
LDIPPAQEAALGSYRAVMFFFFWGDFVMGILAWLVIGIVTGSVAKFVMPCPAAGGMAVAIPLGI